MGIDAQSKGEEIADFLGLGALSEAQLDDIVGGAHSVSDIITASKPWYDLYRKDGMSSKEAMKAVYESNLSSDDREVVKPILQLRGIDIE